MQELVAGWSWPVAGPPRKELVVIGWIVGGVSVLVEVYAMLCWWRVQSGQISKTNADAALRLAKGSALLGLGLAIVAAAILVAGAS